MKSHLIISRIFVFVTITAIGLSCAGQKTQYGIMFYNVENLFDTIDTPEKMDGEFTPASKKNWNTEKYFTKLQNLAQVIASPDNQLPVLIGLCEVENRDVLNDLVLQNILAKGNYRIVHSESPDERGIDVALLYQESIFSVTQFYNIHVALPVANGGATRDILYVQGRFKKVKQEVHIFINHWPSRSEGEEITRERRAIAANTLRTQIDSLNALYKDPAIIIMGDFNDTPFDNSIREILQAESTSDAYADECLVNLMADLQKNNYGSYNYKGNWQALDQFIVSEVLITGKPLQVKYGSVQFIKNDFQLYKNKNDEYMPNRTYSGDRYYGGYSDHLPVYMLLEEK